MPCYHCAGWWWWWCNGVGDIFLAHFRPLSANWALFKCHGLPEHCFWPCPSLQGHHGMYTSSDGYFQQDNAPCHKARIISNWFLEHDNEFTVLNVVEWEIVPWMCIPQISINCKMLSYQNGPTFLKNAFSTLLNQCQEEIKAVQKAKGGQTQY